MKLNHQYKNRACFHYGFFRNLYKAAFNRAPLQGPLLINDRWHLHALQNLQIRRQPRYHHGLPGYDR